MNLLPALTEWAKEHRNTSKKKETYKDKIKIKGAKHNNLQSINVDFPLGCMTSVTGVSGSGKSSLVSGILAPSLQRALHNADTSPGKHKSIEGIEKIDKTIIIDQSPIGNTTFKPSDIHQSIR